MWGERESVGPLGRRCNSGQEEDKTTTTHYSSLLSWAPHWVEYTRHLWHFSSFLLVIASLFLFILQSSLSGSSGCYTLWPISWHPLQYYALAVHGRRSRWALIDGVARSRTRLADFTAYFHMCQAGNGNPQLNLFRRSETESLMSCCL